MKRLKKIGSIIANVFILLCLTPWLAMRIFGSIFGSLAGAFMNGFSKGVVAFEKISVNLHYLQIKDKENKKLKVEKK